MIVNLPDHMINDLGEMVFTGLVKVTDEGTLLVLVPIVDTDDDDEPSWLGETMGCPAARSFAAQLAVRAAGGGTA